MTASISPDDNSFKPKDSSEAPGFVYDDPNTPQPVEPAYVPEREFVLMPLFRRIGEMLGIHRAQEPEYISEAEGPAPETPHQPEPQHQLDLVHNEATFVHEQAAPAEPSFAAANNAETRPPTEFHEPLPSVAPAIPEPTVFEAAAATEPELPVLEAPVEAPSSHFEASAPEPIIGSSVPFEEAQVANQEFLADEIETRAVEFEQAPEHPPASEALIEEAPLAAANLEQAKPDVASTIQRRKAPARRPDELDEAIAMLREAGSKISAVVSEAIEWLSAKENELVRKAERSLGPAPKTRRIPSSAARSETANRMAQESPSSSDETANASEASPESPEIPKWEPLAFPSLQREVAWKEEGGPALVEQPQVRPTPPVTEPASVLRRPTLVPSRPRVPFWKRIDWAEQFTPKRVAVLGGLTMAVLLVLGVSLARRPASEVLPPQPRPIRPGGVTVTTHPATAAPSVRASQPHRTPAPAQPAATPSTHRGRRAAAYDDEPDVVTHYYKTKPSPSKQATVAGVKHYSDLE